VRRRGGRGGAMRALWQWQACGLVWWGAAQEYEKRSDFSALRVDEITSTVDRGFPLIFLADVAPFRVRGRCGIRVKNYM
jgi:hypothetical protein